MSNGRSKGASALRPFLAFDVTKRTSDGFKASDLRADAPLLLSRRPAHNDGLDGKARKSAGARQSSLKVPSLRKEATKALIAGFGLRLAQSGAETVAALRLQTARESPTYAGLTPSPLCEAPRRT